MNYDRKLQLPYYLQFAIKLFMIILIGVLIVYMKMLFVPLAFAILLSILLLPLANFFQAKLHFSKALSALSCIIIALGLIAGLIYFLSHEISSFARDIPSIKEHLTQHYKTLTHWVQQKFNLNKGEQTKLIQSATGNVKDKGVGVLGTTVITLTSIIFYTLMVAIYSLLILYYRHNIKRFLYAVFKEPLEPDVTYVLDESKMIVQKYVAGLGIEMAVVALCNTLFLLILGVKYAIFLGVFAAILNIIPYVGIVTGLLFACLVTLTTTTQLSQIVWIAIGFWAIHFVDSNFLMPRIVGSKVKINALITIIGVVIGGMLIGLPGIFLALPTIAILKVIFDRVEDLKPWGALMGDDTERKKNNMIQRLQSRFRAKPHIKTVDNPGKDTI